MSAKVRRPRGLTTREWLRLKRFDRAVKTAERRFESGEKRADDAILLIDVVHRVAARFLAST